MLTVILTSVIMLSAGMLTVILTNVVMLSAGMLTVVLKNVFLSAGMLTIERSDKFRYAECWDADCHSDKRRFAECRSVLWVANFLKPAIRLNARLAINQERWWPAAFASLSSKTFFFLFQNLFQNS
jgi:hypothetical protein